MMSTDWQIFKNPEDTTEVSLVFSNLTEDDILLKVRRHEPEGKKKTSKLQQVHLDCVLMEKSSSFIPCSAFGNLLCLQDWLDVVRGSS